MRRVIVLMAVAGLFGVAARTGSAQEDSDDEPVIGGPNQAAVTCIDAGYTYLIHDEEGGANGYCIFPDGSWCGDWAFHDGDCSEATGLSVMGSKHSYNITGYDCLADDGWALDSSFDFVGVQSDGMLRFESRDVWVDNPFGWDALHWYDDWHPITRTRARTLDAATLAEISPLSSLEYLPRQPVPQQGDSFVWDGDRHRILSRAPWRAGEGRDTFVDAWIVTNSDTIRADGWRIDPGDKELWYDVATGLLVRHLQTDTFVDQYNNPIGYRFKKIGLTDPAYTFLVQSPPPSAAICSSLPPEEPEEPDPSEEDYSRRISMDLTCSEPVTPFYEGGSCKMQVGDPMVFKLKTKYPDRIAALDFEIGGFWEKEPIDACGYVAEDDWTDDWVEEGDGTWSRTCSIPSDLWERWRPPFLDVTVTDDNGNKHLAASFEMRRRDYTRLTGPTVYGWQGEEPEPTHEWIAEHADALVADPTLEIGDHVVAHIPQPTGFPGTIADYQWSAKLMGSWSSGFQPVDVSHCADRPVCVIPSDDWRRGGVDKGFVAITSQVTDVNGHTRTWDRWVWWGERNNDPVWVDGSLTSEGSCYQGPLTFSGEAVDPDGDDVHYQWYADGKHLPTLDRPRTSTTVRLTEEGYVFELGANVDLPTLDTQQTPPTFTWTEERYPLVFGPPFDGASTVELRVLDGYGGSTSHTWTVDVHPEVRIETVRYAPPNPYEFQIDQGALITGYDTSGPDPPPPPPRTVDPRAVLVKADGSISVTVRVARCVDAPDGGADGGVGLTVACDDLWEQPAVWESHAGMSEIRGPDNTESACDPGDVCEVTLSLDTDPDTDTYSDGVHRVRAQHQYDPTIEDPVYEIPELTPSDEVFDEALNYIILGDEWALSDVAALGIDPDCLPAPGLGSDVVIVTFANDGPLEDDDMIRQLLMTSECYQLVGRLSGEEDPPASITESLFQTAVGCGKSLASFGPMDLINSAEGLCGLASSVIENEHWLCRASKGAQFTADLLNEVTLPLLPAYAVSETALNIWGCCNDIVCGLAGAGAGTSGAVMNEGDGTDLDLHAVTRLGEHVGVNPETGEYEIGIPGAAGSGDTHGGTEWINVPESAEATFYVDATGAEEEVETYELTIAHAYAGAEPVAVTIEHTIERGQLVEHDYEISPDHAEIRVGPTRKLMLNNGVCDETEDRWTAPADCDLTAPTIGEVRLPSAAVGGERVGIEADVEDDAALLTVVAAIDGPPGTARQTATLGLDPGTGTFRGEWPTAGVERAGTYVISVYAVDEAGHVAEAAGAGEIEIVGTTRGLLRELLWRPAPDDALYRRDLASPRGDPLDWPGAESDPLGEYDAAAILSLRGYAHGEASAAVTLTLDVPADADVVDIPLATALNGPSDETDSEAGVVITVTDPVTGENSTTYAANVVDTQMGETYLHAFGDVSLFTGRTVELEVRLLQPDVCAGGNCTHDIDLLVGPVQLLALPGFCAADAEGNPVRLDFPTDPAPQPGIDCTASEGLHVIEVTAGAPQPLDRFGPGTDTYRIDFTLPDNFIPLELALDYGPTVSRFVVNGHEIPPEVIHGVFPFRPGTDDRLPDAARWSFANRDHQLLAPYLVPGANTIEVEITATDGWEERPFSFWARFLGYEGVEPGAQSQEESPIETGTGEDGVTATTETGATETGLDGDEDSGGIPWPLIGAVAVAIGLGGVVVVLRRRPGVSTQPNDRSERSP